jgi:hypothetical protein
MQEIWVPELLISLFLLLALIQPRIKKLWPLKGLVWLPVPAFLIALSLFPAYGFRPEAAPLLILSILITIIRLPLIISSIGQGNNEEYTEGGIFFTLPALVLLCGAMAAAIAFSPLDDPLGGPSSAEDAGIYAFSARNNGGPEYVIRVYGGPRSGPYGAKRPLLVLSPPLYGAAGVVEYVCGELQKRGFTVLTYSRRGFDSGISPLEWVRRFRVFSLGALRAADNARGRLLEKEREKDILFILSRVLLNPRLGEGLSLFDLAARDTMFLAGWDAGGSALVLLAGDSEFVRTHSYIKGIIAVESPLWSSYTGEVREYGEPPPDAGWFFRVKAWAGRRLGELKPKKTAGLEAFPGCGYPLLFLVSDRALDDKFSRPYEAVRQYLRLSPSPVMLAAAEGAGPLDYSDFPVKYPLLSVLFPGRRKGVWNARDAAGSTASIIADFAARLPGTSLLQKTPLPANMHIEGRVPGGTERVGITGQGMDPRANQRVY